jgi:lipopolysaccharide heptosyltransferase II
VSFSRIVIRATNWVGDAVMSLPALHAIRSRFPGAHISMVARPWVADLYAREEIFNEMIPYDRGRLDVIRRLKAGRFDCALLLQNAFDAALIAWLSRIPRRIGYSRDARGWLLTDAIPVPRRGEIPHHQRFYYLELLRRAGWIEQVPDEPIRLKGIADARAAGLEAFGKHGLHGPVVGVSPGAAYGGAKRWLPERFADTARSVANQLDGGVALFGSRSERAVCESIAGQLGGPNIHDFAGETSLGQFIDLTAACRVFITNDSGAMHIASALEVPTVAVFGATDEIATGPTGPLAKVVRQPVDCSPCLLRECPIDHRCMTRVTSREVAEAALELLK